MPTHDILSRAISDHHRFAKSRVISTPTDADVFQVFRIPPKTFVKSITINVTTLDADGVIDVGYDGAAGTDADAFFSAAALSAVGTISSINDDAKYAEGGYFDRGAVVTVTTTAATAVFSLFIDYVTIY